jgi:hypothetical protein
MLGPELIQDTCDKVLVIKERISAAQSQQKSYADNLRSGGPCVPEGITYKGSDAV